jgi:hypothetical protein
MGETHSLAVTWDNLFFIPGEELSYKLLLLRTRTVCPNSQQPVDNYKRMDEGLCNLGPSALYGYQKRQAVSNYNPVWLFRDKKISYDVKGRWWSRWWWIQLVLNPQIPDSKRLVAIRSLTSHLVDVLSGAKLNIWPQALALRLTEEYRLKVLEKGVPRRAFRLRK